MVAAAAYAARQNAQKRRKGSSTKTRVSFHLKLHLGEEACVPEGNTSVGWLRSPLQNPAEENQKERPADKRSKGQNLGTRFEVCVKKYNHIKYTQDKNKETMCQERLLIVTDRRLFIVAAKETKSVCRSADTEGPFSNDVDLEIVDSIALEEIISVDFNDGSRKWEIPTILANGWELKESMQKTFENLSERLGIDLSPNKRKADERKEKVRETLESYDNVLTPEVIHELRELDPEYHQGLLRIVTDPEGFNRGNPYFFLLKIGTFKKVRKATKLNTWRSAKTENSPSEPNCSKIVRKLEKLVARRCRDVKRETWFLRFQTHLQRIWNSKRFNLAVLFLILSNFAFTVQQLENKDPSRQTFFETIELAYTIIFSLELTFNFLAHALWPFLHDGWALFDAVVICVSVSLLIAGTGGNSWLKQLRVLRALRLFRLLGKTGNLRKIVTAVAMSIVPTLQALLIGLVVVFVYAVLGLQFFAARAEESFGTFSRAAVTLLSFITTLQGWPAELPFMVQSENASTGFNNWNATIGQAELDTGVIIYSFSFAVVSLLVLVQANKKLEEDDIQGKFSENDEHPLDFFLKDIAEHFEDNGSLDSLLEGFFNDFDTDQNEFLSFSEFSIGLKLAARARGVVVPKLDETYFTDQEWPGINSNQTVTLDKKGFKHLMRLELRKYLQRNTRKAELMKPSFDVLSTLQAMRIVLVEQTENEKIVNNVVKELKHAEKKVEILEEKVTNIEEKVREIQESALLTLEKQDCLHKTLGSISQKLDLLLQASSSSGSTVQVALNDANDAQDHFAQDQGCTAVMPNFISFSTKMGAIQVDPKPELEDLGNKGMNNVQSAHDSSFCVPNVDSSLGISASHMEPHNVAWMQDRPSDPNYMAVSDFCYLSNHQQPGSM